MTRAVLILASILLISCETSSQPRSQGPRYVPIQNPAQVAEAQCRVEAREYVDGRIAEIRRKYDNSDPMARLAMTGEINLFERTFYNRFSGQFEGFMNNCMQTKGFQRNQ